MHDRICGMKKLTLADYRALAEFRYQIREFFAFSDRAVLAAGLERGQYQLMLAIKGMPEGQRPRIRELANQLHVQHHSAVELINRLEAGGYVRRERTEEDRREVLSMEEDRRHMSEGDDDAKGQCGRQRRSLRLQAR